MKTNPKLNSKTNPKNFAGKNYLAAFILTASLIMAGAALAQSSSGASCNGNPCTLSLNVYVRQNVEMTIEPARQGTLAGNKLTYKISLTNPNPIPLDLRVQGTGPAGWNMTFPSIIKLGAKGSQFFNTVVTSSNSSAAGTYLFTLSVANQSQSLSSSVSGTYMIGDRGAPDIDVTPLIQVGMPGDTRIYGVAVTNNDPADFDASTIFLKAIAPQGWQAIFTTPSLRLKPSETGSTNLTVTSPRNISEPINQQIIANATTNGLSSFVTVSYNVSLCGDRICQLDEVCAEDCVPEQRFSCLNPGRCEQTGDDGVSFSTTTDSLFTKFLICKFSSTPDQCEADYGKNSTKSNTICGSVIDSRCSVRCVDEKGAYYIYTKGIGSTTRSLSNYSFACPFVNLPELIKMKGDFSLAIDSYEQEQSVLMETMKSANDTVKAKLQPCLDALTGVVKDVAAYNAYLGQVISSPAVSNTTQARSRAVDLKNSIDTRLNQYCRGTLNGLLKIESLDPPGLIEVNRNATANVKVTNVGGITYYGYTECAFTLGAINATQRDTCKQYSPGQSSTFTPSVQVTQTGTWTLQCKSIGSLKQDCSTSVHDVETIDFSVFSKDINVVDVSGTCDSIGIKCVVRASQPLACTGCRITVNNATSECQKLSQNGSTSTFDCQRREMDYTNLTGYVTAGANCNPLEPSQKEASVLCAGCGNGIVEGNETCELAGSDNNKFVKQTAGLKCQSTKSYLADSLGFCTNSCQGAADTPVYTCIAGSCGATCSDGQVKDILITNGTKSCYATAQCSSACAFTQPTCEPRDSASTLVIAAHDPLLPPPGDVTINAAAFSTNGIATINIVVNNATVKTCTSSPCSHTAKYNEGVYTYYATATDMTGAAGRDPSTGPKTFTVSTPKPVSGNDTTPPLVSITHTPLLPSISDNIIFTAAASDESGIASLQILVDGTLRATCPAASCSYNTSLAVGSHSYYAVGKDKSGNSGRDMLSGVRVLVVTQGGQSQSSTVTNGAISLTTTISGTMRTNGVVTISAVSNVSVIEIFVDGASRKKCTSSPCAYQSSYSAGSHTYYATAAGGNSTLRNPQSGVSTFAIFAAGSRCGITVTSKTCLFDSKINRYIVNASAQWSGIGTADHAHIIIDGDSSKKFYTNGLARSLEVGAGQKTIIAVAHDANDNDLCLDQQAILCGGEGNITGQDVMIARGIPATVHTGMNAMHITFSIGKDIANLTITENVPKQLQALGMLVEPAVEIKTTPAVAGGQDYNTYSFSVDAKAGDKYTMMYNASFPAGSHNFFSSARYGLVQIDESKSVFATDCPQITRALANKGAECQSFVTVCDIPAGWTKVDTCSPDSQQAQAESIDLVTILIVIVAFAAIAGIAFLKRNKLKEMLEKFSRENSIVKKIQREAGQ